MDNTYSLSPDALRAYNRWHWLVALALLALLLLLPWLFGIGPNSWRTCLPTAPVATAPAAIAPAPSVIAPAPTPAPAAVPTPAPAEVPAPAAAAASIPSARVYFELDKFDLPGDADRTLADVVAYLKAHPESKALVSGYHDPRGDIAKNQELALNRARSVRSALERAGIPLERIVMDKPQQTTGTGPNEEARRVEVRIQS